MTQSSPLYARASGETRAEDGGRAAVSTRLNGIVRVVSGLCAASLGSTPFMATMHLTTSLVHGPLTPRRYHFGSIAAKHKDVTIAAPYVPPNMLPMTQRFRSHQPSLQPRSFAQAISEP